jgi:hypothetical protein
MTQGCDRSGCCRLEVWGLLSGGLPLLLLPLLLA